MRVLVIDPDADNRTSWALFLGCVGHHVAIAADVPSAMQLGQNFRPQAVLTEIALPGVDGWQLARWLRDQETDGRLLLVALTWFWRKEDRLRSEQAGFDYFLTKPADPLLIQDLLEAFSRLSPATEPRESSCREDAGGYLRQS